MKQAIIVFQKYPAPGKVKTRLAAKIGNEKAVYIYSYLLNYTHQLLARTKADVLVFHDGQINKERYPAHNYYFYQQVGDNLGEKMYNAFEQAFKEDYGRVLIIGTDCFELQQSHIEEALDNLVMNDLVLGPANDGGYYLIGLNKNDPRLFENIEWSTKSVFTETMDIAKKIPLKTHLLESLNDIDEYKDLNEALKGLVSKIP
ncbi:TIGR04282 family arsenosugar biosynthesis glycosyltransferase [uncultured Cyclobacterium sp.]|uniref:TIGR04282 family arsenosugar biosynthesis glycosyltransferase n=1 Tax=uncultured Cyclobacterium sp. TaxID=453820 RepID=UPI0030EC1214|tara:strand:- start:27179 stop:27784 length:606 start_codon:yes stop_codon:yes gene_type:complete